MYMAHRAPELFPGASCFAVAHCTFRLRGQESDDDEAFVRDFCAKAGYTCHVKAFDTSSFASRWGISIEMAAREVRLVLRPSERMGIRCHGSCTQR